MKIKLLNILLPMLVVFVTVASACSRREGSAPVAERATDGCDMDLGDKLSVVDSHSLMPVDVDTKPIAIEMSRAADNGVESVISIAGNYPTSDNAVSDSIRRYINAKVTGNIKGYESYQSGYTVFNQYADRFLADACDDVSECEMFYGYEESDTFSIVYRTNKIITCLFDTYVYTGGAHGSSAHLPASFDLHTGLLITWDRLLQPGAFERLRAKVVNEIDRQYFSAGNSGYESLKDAGLVSVNEIELPIANPELLGNGVQFTYNQYEIACYAAGLPSCVIDYQVLEPYMTPWAKGLLFNNPNENN